MADLPFQAVLSDEDHSEMLASTSRTVAQRVLGIVEGSAGKPLGAGHCS